MAFLWVLVSVAGCGNRSINAIETAEICGNGVVEIGETCDGTCPTVCDDGSECTLDVLSGTAANCDVICSHVLTITACGGGDGCCPAGCGANDDSDCPPECGNGVVEIGEICDGNCPTGCDDGDACSTDTMLGHAATCDALCSHEPVMACVAGDNCCPSYCNANTDPDCPSVCGDGVVEPGETCDGDCPLDCDDDNPCTVDILQGNAATCDVLCSHQIIVGCVGGDGCCSTGCNANTDSDCSPTCGNAVLEGGEICELDCPTDCDDGITCTADIMRGNAATCDAVCSHVPIIACASGDGCCPTGCHGGNDPDCPSICGNGVLEPGETCDGTCPTACSDGDLCTDDMLEGSAATCTAMCVYEPIAMPCLHGDGCCPPGCNANTDSDCTPVCGNGVIEGNEVCDGTHMPGLILCHEMLPGTLGYVHCDENCQLDTQPCCPDDQWHIQVVDNSTSDCESSLALDSLDQPHISYHGTNDELMYARWNGTAWLAQVVDSVVYTNYTSLALDSSDQPHIGYYDALNDDLKYANWEGATWHIQVVDTWGDVGQHVSLALDSLGHPHIGYLNYDELWGDDLKYAYWDGASWQIQVVSHANNKGISLALDNGDLPHIAIYDGMPLKGLKYLFWSGGSWQTRLVAGGPYQLWSPSLALDGDGKPHIAYEVPNQWGLDYAHWNEGAWQIETLGSGITALKSPSLALDRAQYPHISYVETAGNILTYAYWDGSSWQFRVVGVAASYWRSSSLALDREGHPHISYNSNLSGDITYARLVCP